MNRTTLGWFEAGTLLIALISATWNGTFSREVQFIWLIFGLSNLVVIVGYGLVAIVQQLRKTERK